jgi:hypothetical protein
MKLKLVNKASGIDYENESAKLIIINTLFKLLKIPSAMLLVLTGEQ